MGWILMGLFAIPMTIFVIFIVPIWLFMHYYGNKTGRGELSTQERQRLIQLSREAQQMRERIQVLESILDTEQPNWR